MRLGSVLLSALLLGTGVPEATRAQQCGARGAGVTFFVESVAPRPGTVVTVDSVFQIRVRYQVPRFRQGEWTALPVLATTVAGSTRSGPADLTAALLPDSAGVLQRTVAFGAVWHDAGFARPFRIFVMLTERNPDGSHHIVTCLGPFEYPTAPAASGERPAQELPSDSTMLSDAELTRLMDSSEADPMLFMRLLVTDRPRAAAFVRTGLERRPAERGWGNLASMLCMVEGPERRRLSGADRVAAYERARRCITAFVGPVTRAYEINPGSRSARIGYEAVQELLGESALESGALADAARIATELLQRNTDTTWLMYGAIIHKANQLLGRVALRQGNLEEAKRFLLAAGRTPGGPGLAGYGPNHYLARELLERGEREVVLEYLELVGHPRYDTYSRLHDFERWKTEIRLGGIPRDVEWN